MSEHNHIATKDMQNDCVLQLRNIKKSYNIGQPTEVEVLHGIDFLLDRGEFAALVGPSGSGKSTLLNILGLLDQPTSGELFLLGLPTSSLSDECLTALRRHNIGFVFQFHHLIEAFSVLDNVLMPMMITHGKPDAETRDWGMHLLELVGLKNTFRKKPSELSGGQQQRVSIARALVTRPALLLADEPTGNLDTHTASSVFEMLRRFHQEFSCAVLIVTHDPRISQACSRTLTLVDGSIISDERHPRET